MAILPDVALALEIERIRRDNYFLPSRWSFDSTDWQTRLWEAYVPRGLRRIRDLLRDSAGTRESASQLVRELSDCFTATHCGLISVPSRHTGLTVMSEFTGDHAAAAAYENYYSAISPWRQPILRLAEGSVATDIDLCEPSTFRRSEFYEDFGRKFGVVRTLGLVVHRNEYESTFISLDRGDSDRPYDELSIDQLKGLCPEIQQFVKLHRAQELAGTFQHAFDLVPEAMAILRKGGQMVHANPLFESCYRECFNMDSGGILSARAPYGETFRRALNSAISTGHPSELVILRDCFVTVLPHANQCAIVRIRQTNASVRVNGKLARAFRLTPAEIRLAEQLLVHPTLIQAAAALGIAVGTAKTQLRSSFVKTGSNNQKELLLRIARQW